MQNRGREVIKAGGGIRINLKEKKCFAKKFFVYTGIINFDQLMYYQIVNFLS